MSFTFLHAADLHLGSPFKGLSNRHEDLADRLASAGRDAFAELIDRAIAEKVAFAVIAGDIFDGEWKDMAIGHFFNRKIAELSRAGIPVYIVKGNHDAASVVTRSLPMPENVHVFPTDRAETLEIGALQVAIHGRSFEHRVISENLALTYPAAVSGWFNIGVLHTSLAGNPAHETYAPCSVADLATRGYDYWALGHVHEYEEIARDPWIVFPGNLQGRSIRECGAKGAVFVDVDDGRVANVRRVIVDKARFALLDVDISGLESPAEVHAQIRRQFTPLDEVADGRVIAARVRLTGASPLHRRIAAAARQWQDDVLASLQQVNGDAQLEKLSIHSREPTPESGTAPGGEEPSLIDVEALLGQLAQDPALRAEAESLLAGIRDKMPAEAQGSIADLADDIDAMLADARAVVLAGDLERAEG